MEHLTAHPSTAMHDIDCDLAIMSDNGQWTAHASITVLGNNFLLKCKTVTKPKVANHVGVCRKHCNCPRLSINHSVPECRKMALIATRKKRMAKTPLENMLRANLQGLIL